MSGFTVKQFSVSTAEDERNYFTGEFSSLPRPNPNTILPPGIYRVIDGSIYRIVGVAPPTAPGAKNDNSD